MLAIVPPCNILNRFYVRSMSHVFNRVADSKLPCVLVECPARTLQDQAWRQSREAVQCSVNMLSLDCLLATYSVEKPGSQDRLINQ